MKKEKVEFAIIGTGMIAERHAAALAEVEDAVLRGVYDLNRERAEKFAEDRKVKAYASFEELLEDPELDAVTIATPTGTHLEVVEPCAKAGKHVLCEKPLEVTLERTDAVIDACERGGVILSAVFQSRFSDQVALIEKTMKEGRFGRLTLCSAQVKWYRSQEYYDNAGWRGTWRLDGGGALMNQSIHIVDLLLHLVGKPKSVHAYMDTLTHTNLEVEDNLCAAVRFENGAMGVVEASTSCAPGFPRRLEISGENGSVILEDDSITRWEFVDERPEDAEIRAGATSAPKLKSGAGDPRAASHEGHKRQLADLTCAVKCGESPKIPGSEGRRAVELICAIYESARSGVPVGFD